MRFAIFSFLFFSVLIGIFYSSFAYSDENKNRAYVLDIVDEWDLKVDREGYQLFTHNRLGSSQYSEDTFPSIEIIEIMRSGAQWEDFKAYILSDSFTKDSDIVLGYAPITFDDDNYSISYIEESKGRGKVAITIYLLKDRLLKVHFYRPSAYKNFYSFFAESFQVKDEFKYIEPKYTMESLLKDYAIYIVLIITLLIIYFIWILKYKEVFFLILILLTIAVILIFPTLPISSALGQSILPSFFIYSIVTIFLPKNLSFWEKAKKYPDFVYKKLSESDAWVIGLNGSVEKRYKGPFTLFIPSLNKKIDFYGESTKYKKSQKEIEAELDILIEKNK